MLTPDHIRFLASLAPPEPHWGGTGALSLHADPRDFDIRWIPEVKAALEAGVPPSADMLQYIRGPSQNQGSLPACVAYSTCNLAAIDSIIEGGAWDLYDAHTLYTEAGGTGANGVDTRLTLSIAVEKGIPLASGRRKTIGAYAFAPQQPGVFRETLKAAIVAGHACTLALLLPAPFAWNSGTARTSGYHQVVIVGYDSEWCWVYNSWSDSWPGDSPKPGLGRVRWDYLESDNLQNNYVYAYTTTPTEITPPPPPPPARAATVTGRAQAGATNGIWPVVGQVIPFGQDVVLSITGIQFEGAPPPPPPPELVVSGYAPNPVGSGQPFAIEGKGFSGGNLSVIWQGGSLVAQRETDAQIQAVAPSVASTASAAVTVQVEALHADGPPLTVIADSGPGQLQVTVAAKRYSRGLLGVWAWVQEPGSAALELDFTALPDQAPSLWAPTVLNPEAGGYVAASLTGQVEGGGVVQVLGARQSTATGTPVIWQTVNAPPAPATVTVTAVAGGRSGQGSKSL